MGAAACAILVANNLRDIPTDREVGKRTLAVVLGAERTRALFVLLLGASVVALVGIALTTSPLALLGLLALVPGLRASRVVLRGTTGPGLIPVLQLTGLFELLYAAGIFTGLLIASA